MSISWKIDLILKRSVKMRIELNWLRIYEKYDERSSSLKIYEYDFLIV
jgi:hypothetical protein